MLGIAAFWRGEFEAARKHFESAVEGYRGEHRTAHLVRFGQDPKVVCLSRLANTWWFLGCPRAAVRARDAALALAEDIGHPHSRDVAVVFAALLDLELGDLDRLREGVTALRDSGDLQAPQTLVSTRAMAGYLDVVDGRTQAGLSRIREALEESGETDHAPGLRVAVARLLVAACEHAGEARSLLEAADRALELSHAVRTWTSEIRRVRGEALAALGAPSPDVEEELEIALDVAWRQGARMLELRAAVSLVRYRAERGDATAAIRTRDLLAQVVKTLPEADQTRERREADALLVSI